MIAIGKTELPSSPHPESPTSVETHTPLERQRDNLTQILAYLEELETLSPPQHTPTPIDPNQHPYVPTPMLPAPTDEYIPRPFMNTTPTTPREPITPFLSPITTVSSQTIIVKQPEIVPSPPSAYDPSLSFFRKIYTNLDWNLTDFQDSHALVTQSLKDHTLSAELHRKFTLIERALAACIENLETEERRFILQLQIDEKGTLDDGLEEEPALILSLIDQLRRLGIPIALIGTFVISVLVLSTTFPPQSVPSSPPSDTRAAIEGTVAPLYTYEARRIQPVDTKLPTFSFTPSPTATTLPTETLHPSATPTQTGTPISTLESAVSPTRAIDENRYILPDTVDFQSWLNSTDGPYTTSERRTAYFAQFLTWLLRTHGIEIADLHTTPIEQEVQNRKQLFAFAEQYWKLAYPDGREDMQTTPQSNTIVSILYDGKSDRGKDAADNISIELNKWKNENGG